MSAEQQQQQTPPAAPTNSAQAGARLAECVADQAWGDRLLSGDAATTKEFHELSAMHANGTTDVESAMTGAIPDVPDSGLKTMAGTADMLRAIGIEPGPIRQLLEGYEISQAEHDAVSALKGQLMRSAEFTKSYLAGEPEAVKKMTLCDIVLSSTIKTEKAA
jgi:hypothetical protein